VSRRLPLFACLAVAALVVVARGVPFMAPGVRFDADQAVMGLMAKHIAEGRAFPLYFYGQDYLLALEAYLAAPVMWLLGPTEVALKLPVLAMNVAAACLMAWHAARGVGLRPWLALVSALPFALPPVVVGSRLMDAMGGNIETPFYALVLWTVRDRRWLFGAGAAVALAHRELVAYPLAALLALEAIRGAWRSRETCTRWAIAALSVLVLQGALAVVRPHAAMFGPGTVARDYRTTLSSAEVVRGQICLDTSQWPARAGLLVREHLPLMTGGLPGPLVDLGVSTGMGQGRPGLFVWTVGLVLAGLAAGWQARRSPAVVHTPGATAPAPGAGRPETPTGERPTPRGLDDAVPAAWLPWFLLLAGLVSSGVYALVSCANITTHTLRYNLLVVFLPAGAVLAGLRHHARAVRAGLVAALLVGTWPAADDYRALAGEIARGRWPDPRGEAAAALAGRGPAAYWGDFRVAYLLTFRGAERFTVASIEHQRIEEYATRAQAANAGVVKVAPCPGGEVLAEGLWLCPPGTR
jgi:hypothetical protein